MSKPTSKPLLEKIKEGKIDLSFVVTPTSLENGARDVSAISDKQDGAIKVMPSTRDELPNDRPCTSGLPPRRMVGIATAKSARRGNQT